MARYTVYLILKTYNMWLISNQTLLVVTYQNSDLESLP